MSKTNEKKRFIKLSFPVKEVRAASAREKK
jgi:adenine-specific DNA methylase